MQGRPWKQQQGYRAVPDRGEIIVQAVVPFLIYAIATEILLLSCPFFKGDAAQAANVIAGCLTVAVWGKLRKRREPKKEDRSRLLSRENAVFIGALLAAGIFYCMGGSGLLTLIFFGVSKKSCLRKAALSGKLRLYISLYRDLDSCHRGISISKDDVQNAERGLWNSFFCSIFFSRFWYVPWQSVSGTLCRRNGIFSGASL